jgi:hypothetical protein
MSSKMLLSLGLAVVATAACNDPAPQNPPDDGQPGDEGPSVARASAMDGLNQVTQVRGVQPGAVPETGEPSELQVTDEVITFTGNGVLTPTDVMSRAIAIYSGRDPTLKQFAATRDAAYLAAHESLAANPKLSRNPDRPIPEGERFVAGGVGDLKALLAPFVNNLGKLRELVADAKTSLGGQSKTTGHGVHSQAKTLPVAATGDAGTEPSPVMGSVPLDGQLKSK